MNIYEVKFTVGIKEIDGNGKEEKARIKDTLTHEVSNLGLTLIGPLSVLSNEDITQTEKLTAIRKQYSDLTLYMRDLEVAFEKMSSSKK